MAKKLNEIVFETINSYHNNLKLRVDENSVIITDCEFLVDATSLYIEIPIQEFKEIIEFFNKETI